MKILTFLQSFWGRFFVIVCLLVVLFSALFVASIFVSGFQVSGQTSSQKQQSDGVAPSVQIDPKVATAQNPIKDIYVCTTSSLNFVGDSVRERMRNLITDADKVLVENSVEKMNKAAKDIVEYFVASYASSLVSEAGDFVRQHPYISARLRAQAMHEIKAVEENANLDNVKQLCDSVLALSTTLGDVQDIDKKNRYSKIMETPTVAPTPSPEAQQSTQSETDSNSEESNQDNQSPTDQDSKTQPNQSAEPDAESSKGSDSAEDGLDGEGAE